MADATKAFTVSAFVGDDVVVRLSLRALQRLCDECVLAMATVEEPKLAVMHGEPCRHDARELQRRTCARSQQCPCIGETHDDRAFVYLVVGALRSVFASPDPSRAGPSQPSNTAAVGGAAESVLSTVGAEFLSKHRASMLPLARAMWPPGILLQLRRCVALTLLPHICCLKSDWAHTLHLQRWAWSTCPVV